MRPGKPQLRGRVSAAAPLPEPNQRVHTEISTSIQVPKSPEFTLRAVLTGMFFGALLTPCNIYSGLKIGWSFNMSIAAALLSLAFWRAAERAVGARDWGLLENNINQTTASSAASIISGGLVAPIPALTLLTGRELPWSVLWIWVFAVSLLGVVVAVLTRHQLIVRDRLAFPAGIATAETVKEIYGKGREAIARVRVLLCGGVASAGLKFVNDFVTPVPRLGAAVPVVGGSGATLTNLGFMVDPSLLMIGFGIIIGLRAALSLLLGAVLAWGVLGPWSLAGAWAAPGPPRPDVSWFAPLVEWLLWPGVTLMVSSSLVSLAVALTRRHRSRPRAHAETETGEVPRRWFLPAALVALLLCTVLQIGLFGISLPMAVAAVMFSMVLAAVAGRVSGETGINPIGAMGKITQLSFGLLNPGNVINNLMSANVTGGAAGQCADLLHDLKAGRLLGATPRLQILAQTFGVLTGSLVGSAVYLLLIPDPQSMLITDAWPAPAVVTWKAVAEVFQGGLEALPPASVPAMGIAVLCGVFLTLLSHLLPPRMARWLPSMPAVGLAFVIPAYNSISFFLGALLASVIGRIAPSWAARFLIALAAGLVAGESLAGVAGALTDLLSLH